MTGPASRVRRGVVGALVLAASLGACADASGPAADVTGRWGIQDTEGVVSLELAADGTASGTDGCNRMVGTWEQDGTQVAFGEWGLTRMACPSLDTWLSLAVQATLEGDDLVVVDGSGVVIGTLQPNS